MLRYVAVVLLVAAKVTDSANYTQEDLVKHLEKKGFFENGDAVRNALLQVNRRSYMGDTFTKYVASDLGYGATFCPLQVAFAMETLQKFLKEGSKILDVGSGSGYQAVCMALMVGKTGYVVAVEHIPELLNASIENTKKDKPFLLEEKRLRFIEGDGRKGVPELGPYDAIHIGALAPEPPHALLDQLKPMGRLVIPLDYGSAEGGDQYHQLWVFKNTMGKEEHKILKNGFFKSKPPEPLQDKENQLLNSNG